MVQWVLEPCKLLEINVQVPNFGVKFWQPFKVISWTIFNSLADMGNKTCDCSHSVPQLRKRLIVSELESI